MITIDSIRNFIKKNQEQKIFMPAVKKGCSQKSILNFLLNQLINQPNL